VLAQNIHEHKGEKMKATWNGKILAESDETIYIEGNQYFPPASVNRDFLVDSDFSTVCHWKGTSNYYDLVDGDTKAANAAWYYPTPKEGSDKKVGYDYTNYVAFYPQHVTVA
jgi:uncharacterized protein (DUF427 family)